MLGVVTEPYFDWGDDRPPRRPYAETVIYETHVRGLTRTHPDVPAGAARHLRRTRAPRGRRAPDLPRRHGGRADAGAPVRPGRRAPGPGPVQLLGLQHDRLLRAAQRLRRPRHPRPAGQRVQVDGEGAARGRPRSDPRRGLQPHRRGQRAGPDPLLPRHRQRLVLPPGGRRLGALLRHHRHRQQPADAPPVRPPADHGLAALLGHRDARRRLPLRPGGHAGPPVPRGGPALGVLRPDPAGPGDQPCQADRRAVGRGRGRLPGGQLPAAVVGVERQVPGRRTGLLARRARFARRVRLPADRLLRPVRSTADAARAPASTSSPRTTGSPCATSSRTTTSTTRPTARATGTARATTGPGTAAPRARPTTRPCSGCAPVSSATSWPRCCCRRASPCSATATNSAAPSAATTTPTARTTSVSWVDWGLTDEQRALADFTRHVIGLRAAHPVLRRRRFFQGETATHPTSPCPTWCGSCPTAREMTDEDWQRPDAHSVAVFLNGDAIAERGLVRRARGGRLVPAAAQQLLGAGGVPPCRTPPSANAGRPDRHRRTARALPTNRSTRRPPPSWWSAAACSCSRGPRDGA